MPSPRNRSLVIVLAALGGLASGSCARYLADNPSREENREVPEDFGAAQAGGGPNAAAQAQWQAFFPDPDLRALIEEALRNNQELNIQLQELIVLQNEIAAARGEYLPRLDAEAGAGIEKVGRHTSQGASDEDHGVAENLPDFGFGLKASWEIDVWGKLRNARKSANLRYQASVEARNFVITEIVAEIANSYYDLVALDRQLEVLERNIGIQQDALEIVKIKKSAARANELEVQRFQAEVLKNQGKIYGLQQQRIQVENRINFLVGRFPQPVQRNDRTFMAAGPKSVGTGLPSELLENRPDVRAAELRLQAAELDTKVAKARFYPSLSLEAGVGYEAFNLRHLLDTPESIAYNLAGNLTAPLLNRAAIKADYESANAKQLQAVYDWERIVLMAYTEVANQLAAIQNLEESYQRIAKQVEALQAAIEVSTILYRSAHADYMEVLLTQRDSLEAEMELIETRKLQMQAMVAIYQALGGGWRTPPQ